MMIIFEVLFWVSVFCIVHSYVIFPLLLEWLSKGRKQNDLTFSVDDQSLPAVSVILAVYNEEAVMEEKIRSTFTTGYPQHKIEFLIGSDASTDQTNSIIDHYQKIYPQIRLTIFPGRTGKAGIVNQLSQQATGEILILTDANVFFTPDTIYELAKHYRNPSIVQVGGHILNPGFKKEGISYQEKSYLNRENLMKYQEGIIWGCMIGAFGGCYSIRASHFTRVPAKFLMEDFYISMYALGKGGKAVNELNAVCYEDVSNRIREEFRRKARISAGNFQNLGAFSHLLLRPTGLAFCFLSHKVLRWFGPVFIILALISNVYLYNLSNFYQLTLFIQAGLLSIPLIDGVLRKMNIHFKLFRFATHFYLMNLALLLGLIRYLKGIEASVWTPTQRNQ